ncbi:MAG: hypothetical protein KAV18_04010, partial [Candidatus Omnitrophica bacterium]|nr:hypothetical protein [Candidatus Omnitrophota bacterium]
SIGKYTERAVPCYCKRTFLTTENSYTVRNGYDEQSEEFSCKRAKKNSIVIGLFCLILLSIFIPEQNLLAKIRVSGRKEKRIEFKPKEYIEAINLCKKGKNEFGLLKFNKVIEKYPDSPWTRMSIFSAAEIYVGLNCYNDAVKLWIRYMSDYPDNKETILAKIYLVITMTRMKGASEVEAEQFLEQLKKQIFSKPVFLGFKEYKKYVYKSAVKNKYELREYVDKIEVYLNGEIFYKIVP